MEFHAISRPEYEAGAVQQGARYQDAKANEGLHGALFGNVYQRPAGNPQKYQRRQWIEPGPVGAFKLRLTPAQDE